MSKTVVTGGRVFTPEGEVDADVVIEDDRIVAIESGADTSDAEVLDATGCLVLPGLVDIHTHLREPGREEAETVETGSRAAALGGYTAVVAMPNTEPTIDNESVVRHVHNAAENALCDVAVAAAITVGRKGTQLSPMGDLASVGVRIFTDDGNGVQDVRLMRRALEYSTDLGVTLAQHCEDEALSAGGHMHEGAVSSRLGIGGVPPEAEELMVMRDIALVRMTNARMHFLHLSTARSVQLVREAKAAGLNITAEAAPHHFTLTHDEVMSFDPHFKVNPPLRTEEDRLAVLEGLRDGTIDAVATDHAPHAPQLKELPFEEAPCGMLGLETAAPLTFEALKGDVATMVRTLSTNPARIAGLEDEHGTIAVGRMANLCVLDPQRSWKVDPMALSSKAHNTPYAGREMSSTVRHTIFRGVVVVRDGKAQR